MKTYIRNSLLITLLSISLFIVGCETVPSDPNSESRVLSHLKTGTTLAYSAVFISIEDLDKKKDIAKKIYVVSDLVEGLADNGDLLPDKLKSVLDEFFPEGSEYATLSPAISELYKNAFIGLDGDAVKAGKYLKTIAGACKLSASAYYKPNN